MSPDREKKRHIRAWLFFLWPVRLFVRLKFSFRRQPEPELPEGGCLILSNHGCPWDPIMLAASFSRPVYFVASEHIFRLGLVSWFLSRYFSPIARLKGSTDAAAAAALLRRLRAGDRVVIFAEGDASWNGLTAPLHPSIARLARMCSVPVATFRFTGGYLTRPRWGVGARPGRMTGAVVRVYAPQELRAMSKEEAARALSADIYEDAYARQAIDPVRYRGRKRAERLETALYICPRCKGVATLRSRGNSFSCPCGLTLGFSEYGYFEGEDAPFKTVAEWDLWQEEQMRLLARSLPEGAPAFSDAGQSLWEQHGHEQSLVARGTLTLYSDRLTLGEASFPISSISAISLFEREHVVFTASGVTYEIKSEKSRSGRKYMTLVNYLKSER